MGMDTALKIIGKTLPQVKKGYVKPTCEIFPIKAFMQKINRQTGYTSFNEHYLNIMSDKNLYDSLRKYLFKEEMKKAFQFETFSSFKITKGLNEAEKMDCWNILYAQGNSEYFYPTIYGAKPACILGDHRSMEILEKLHLGKNIEFVQKQPFSPAEGVNIYNTYVLNKKEVMQIIKQNKEIFTTRLGLGRNAKLSEIYQKLKETLKTSNPLSSEYPADLEGLTIGFPKYNSMIFELGNIGKINPRLRCTPEYKDKLLEVLHSPNSPYKNLSEKEITLLEKKIKQINMSFESIEEMAQKGSYDNDFYKFIKFVDEPQEMERIEKKVNHFQNTFSVSNL